jgi:hypothetical protein
MFACCVKVQKVDQRLCQCIHTVCILLYVTDFEKINVKLILPMKQVFCLYSKRPKFETIRSGQ